MTTPTTAAGRRAIFPHRGRGRRRGGRARQPGSNARGGPLGGDAAAAPPIAGEADGEWGVLLGRRLGGERALPIERGMVVLSPQRLCRHMLVCGATGSGKTETLMRLAWTIARSTEAPVFYIDGKGDRDTAGRFCALMADAGRRARVFPNEPFDAWRGSASEIHGRLMEIVDYANDGPASFYRDIAKTTLRLACDHPDGPPRSSRVLLDRLDIDHLADTHAGSTAVASLTKDQVRQVRLRYEAFFGQSAGLLDGCWSFDDADACYLLLDSLALKEEAGALSRLVFEDFAAYFTKRKPRGKLCILIVDEFSAIASHTGMAARVEQARGFNTAIILAPQVTAGMGDATEAQRITGSVETIICHRVNTPEQIISLAGTRRVVEHSTHYAEGGATGEGSARIQHQYKIDPNKVRSLPPGSAFIINQGRAMKAQILRAPTITAQLPQPELPRPDSDKPAGSGPAPPGKSAGSDAVGENPPPARPRVGGQPLDPSGGLRF